MITIRWTYQVPGGGCKQEQIDAQTVSNPLPNTVCFLCYTTIYLDIVLVFLHYRGA